MMKISLFVLFAVVATASANAVGVATEDAQIEKRMEVGLPPDGKPIMEKLSHIAKRVAALTKLNKVSETAPLFKEAGDELEELEPKLTNPYQRIAVHYLLSPWVRKFQAMIESGKATPETIELYYTIKNAILNALDLIKKGVHGNQAEKDSKIESGLSEKLLHEAPEAAATLKELSDDAHKMILKFDAVFIHFNKK